MVKKRKVGKKRVVKRIISKGLEIKMPNLSVVNKCSPYALAFSLGILSATFMLGLSILGKLGIGLDAVSMMQKMHLTYSLSIGGIIGGIAEGALWGAVIGFLIAWIYNKFI